ncbi:MAG: Branched-chain amino acid transport system permease protein LivM, partial [uncultured Thermomicrobiales bacterium]
GRFPRRQPEDRRPPRPARRTIQNALDRRRRAADGALPVLGQRARHQSPWLVHGDLCSGHPGDGSQHRRRVRGAARPRLRRLLRHRRLHQRLPDLAHLLLRPQRLHPRVPPPLLAGADFVVLHRRLVRRVAGRADAAPAGRLPGDRHPWVRRDRADLFPQRDHDHRRHPGHQPNLRAARDPLLRRRSPLRRQRPAQLVLADARGRPALGLPDQPALRFPARPLLASGPRGRGRRRQHGDQPGPHQAARVRPRRVVLRLRRVHLRRRLPVRPSGPVPLQRLDHDPGNGDPRRPRQHLRRHLRRAPHRQLRPHSGRGPARPGAELRPHLQHPLPGEPRPLAGPLPGLRPRPGADDAAPARRPDPQRQAPRRDGTRVRGDRRRRIRIALRRAPRAGSPRWRARV